MTAPAHTSTPHRTRVGPVLPWLLRALVLGMAAVHAVAAGIVESMNADGVHYLDQGDAWWRGDWRTAVNGTWSPLYPWLLGGTLRLVSPSMRLEFATVHALNFGILVVALLAFERLWKTLRREERTLPSGLWQALGYALFAWATLVLVELWSVTPDLLVATCVFLASAQIVRIADGERSPASFALLGLASGVGYLSKAALLPLGLAALGIAAWAGGLRRSLRPALAGLGVFALVAGPWIAALSLAKGRPTFSDVGALTYLKHVHRVPYPQWRTGVVDGLGRPHHPPRLVLDDPRVWEFAEPVGGTYPLGYDPYYWYEGLAVPVDPAGQLNAMLTTLVFAYELFVGRIGGFLAVALLLVLLVRRAGCRAPPRAGVALLLFAAAAFGMYGLVYVHERYVAPFAALACAALLVWIDRGRLPEGTGLPRLGGALMLVFLAAEVAAFNLAGADDVFGLVRRPEPTTRVAAPPPPRPRPSRVAEALRRRGLAPGDPIGVVGYSFDAGWARLARLRIVAEVAPEEASAVWEGDAGTVARVKRAFARAGARAVVVEPLEGDPPSGFEPLGATGLRIAVVSPDAPGAPEAPSAPPPAADGAQSAVPAGALELHGPCGQLVAWDLPGTGTP